MSQDDLTHKEFTQSAQKLASELTPGMDEYLKTFDALVPGFADSVAEIAYGHVYARPGLAREKRYLVSIAALTAQGPSSEPQLRANVSGALNAGVKPTEIAEAIFQVTLYAGLTNAVNCLAIAKDVIDSHASQDK